MYDTLLCTIFSLLFLSIVERGFEHLPVMAEKVYIDSDQNDTRNYKLQFPRIFLL
jgi:hypothetical protein